MDPIAIAAGTAVVSAMATSAWEQASNGVVTLWRRARPDQAEEVASELEEVRGEVLQARRDGDTDVEQALAGSWQMRLQRMIRADPGLADELQRLLDEELTPVLAAEEQARIGSIVQTATADGGSTIYQAGNNITPPGGRS